jgi:regulatory protein
MKPPRQARPVASLKMQAIGFLSRREYSRQELRIKLLAASRKRERDAQMQAAAAEAEAAALARQPSNGIDDAFAPHSSAPRPDGSTAPASPEREFPGDSDSEAQAEVDTLLDWLEAHGYLSDARFVESRIHARAARQGATRIRHELARHGLALPPEQAAALRETEFARAQAVWQRKFGELAVDARGRAAQARFLAARGFAADVVRRIIGGDEDL